MEDLVIEGVSDILHKLPKKPSVVLLFTVCVHHFMGCDLNYIYDTLRSRFPEQCFVDCYMDPIMQKEGLTPDQKLRNALYKPLPMREKNLKQINIIGNDFPTREETELKTIAKAAGYTVKDITECEGYEEYLSMSESFLNIACYPLAKYGAEQLSKRLGMKFLYLPFSFHYLNYDSDSSILCFEQNVKVDFQILAKHIFEFVEKKLRQTDLYCSFQSARREKRQFHRE